MGKDSALSDSELSDSEDSPYVGSFKISLIILNCSFLGVAQGSGPTIAGGMSDCSEAFGTGEVGRGLDSGFSNDFKTWSCPLRNLSSDGKDFPELTSLNNLSNLLA